MNPAVITSGATWNTALASLPVAHVLQTWEWGQFKSRHGWTPSYLLWSQGQRPTAAALVLRRQPSRLPFCMLYVPKGPAMDYGHASLVNQVLSDLERLARKSHAVFIKIDPDVPTPFSLKGGRIGDESWIKSAEQIQFRNTMEIDLSRSEDELLAAMRRKRATTSGWRRNAAWMVRLGTLDDLELLYEMYDETAHRDRFIIRPLDYYRDAWGSFIEAGLAQPLVAEVERVPWPRDPLTL
jgi:lipid II:glycine glycyltransferase (peptidoglycan interpeptide bridge formation enzyme)